MNKEHISALAREYAEEKAQSDREQGFPESFVKDLSEFNEKGMKSAIEFLLRRFCLVEKSKVEAELITCMSLRDENTAPNIESAIEHHKGIEGIRLLKSLFPEIAKEVEE